MSKVTMKPLIAALLMGACFCQIGFDEYQRPTIQNCEMSGNRSLLPSNIDKESTVPMVVLKDGRPAIVTKHGWIGPTCMPQGKTRKAVK